PRPEGEKGLSRAEARDLAGGRMRADAVEVRQSQSTIGGGSLPDETLPTFVLAIKPKVPAAEFVAALRRSDTPVIARIEEEAVLLDPRTVLPEEDASVLRVLESALAS
ncbi:MAG: L-seryl-tRNA(Sec) selenium transferase, partial [Chloroflexi bacterium]|nr:L-seryl-tRNA(Sec) selenium transferase [Chloroflexota bacterium]